MGSCAGASELARTRHLQRALFQDLETGLRRSVLVALEFQDHLPGNHLVALTDAVLIVVVVHRVRVPIIAWTFELAVVQQLRYAPCRRAIVVREGPSREHIALGGDRQGLDALERHDLIESGDTVECEIHRTIGE